MVHLEVTHTHAVCSYCGSNWCMRIPSYHFTPEFLACVHAKGAVFIKNVFSIRERVARTNSDSYQILKLRPPVSTQDRVTLQKLVVCYNRSSFIPTRTVFTGFHSSPYICPSLIQCYLNLLPSYIK